MAEPQFVRRMPMTMQDGDERRNGFLKRWGRESDLDRVMQQIGKDDL